MAVFLKTSFEAYNESSYLIKAVELAITLNVCWQTRYTEPVRTGNIVKTMESGYPALNLAGQVPTQQLIRDKSIRIIQIESKWNAALA